MVFILDTYSRRIVGWSMENHMRTQLVVDALEPTGLGGGRLRYRAAESARIDGLWAEVHG